MMRSPIPKEIRHELSYDPYMRDCIIKDGQCEGRIEWNHAFSYSGKRQNSIWCILPMCTFHHRTEAAHREEIRDQLRYRLLHFGLEKAAATKYPKSDLFSTLLSHPSL